MIFSEAAILLGGVLSLGMFLFHLGFPRIFGWDRDLQNISEGNRRIMRTIHLALLLLFLLFGGISLVYPRELARGEGLAFGICLLYAGFWLWRTVWQITYFKPGEKHRPLHIVLSAVFILLCLAYAIPVVLALG